MKENEPAPAGEREKKWTEWSVVSTNVGTLRCKRVNAEDEKDAEYRDVPRPVFSPEETTGMIEFGKFGLLGSDDIARQCYDRRYRALAFRLCSELNAQPAGGGV